MAIDPRIRRRPGRPRKFAEPSRAVTVTLPETVFAQLALVDADVSLAIAAVVRRSRHAVLDAAVRPAPAAARGHAVSAEHR